MLLSRGDLITKFNNFVREISKSSALLKQIPIKTEKNPLLNTSKEAKQPQEKATDSKTPKTNFEIFKQQKTNEYNFKKSNFSSKEIKNVLPDNRKEQLDEKNSSIKENYELKSLKDKLKNIKNDSDANYLIKNLFDEPIAKNEQKFKYLKKDSNANYQIKKLSNEPIAVNEQKLKIKEKRIAEEATNQDFDAGLFFNQEKKRTIKDLKPQDKEKYLEILKNMETSLMSANKILPLCQQIVLLNEKDTVIRQDFLTRDIKSLVFNLLIKEIEKMNTNDFLNTLHFLVTIEPAKYESLRNKLNIKSTNFDINQILDLILLLRKTIGIYKKIQSSPESYDLEKFTDMAKEKLDLIDNYRTLKKAMKLFTHKTTKNSLKPTHVRVQEELIVKKLDEKVLKIQNTLTAADWVDLINTKSILRHRNINLIEACVYNLTKLNDENVLTIEAIQSIFLSCGLLSFNNLEFFKFLLNKLINILKSNETNSNWAKEKEKTLNAIINSIGILRLKDPDILDALVDFLGKNIDVVDHNLIISFVKSISSLNYKPSSEYFSQLLAKINLNSFKMNEIKEKILLINYVWSLCVLKIQNQQLVTSVLNESFWGKLIKEFETENPRYLLKPLLLKLFNINLYSILFMDDYDGPTLPETFNASKYVDILKPADSDLKSLLDMTLSSYKTIDKYIKLHLLTPYGILIDALLIIDKNGIPLPLERFFSENQIKETNEELKIAIKLVSYHDFNIVDKNLLGTTSFPMELLRELGYFTLLITQEELQSGNLLDRVNLIQTKLKEIAKNQLKVKKPIQEKEEEKKLENNNK